MVTDEWGVVCGRGCGHLGNPKVPLYKSEYVNMNMNNAPIVMTYEYGMLY